MNFIDVLNAITTVGFPIVACIGLCVYIKSYNDKLYDLTQKNVETMTQCKDELHHVADVIERIEVERRDLFLHEGK